MKISKTTIIAVLLAAIGVLKAAHAPSIQAALLDPQVQISLAAAILGKFAGDGDGTKL